jgi:hypothetical protein
MATAATKAELDELDARIREYFYIQNLRYAEKQRKCRITVRDTTHTRASGPIGTCRCMVHGPRDPNRVRNFGWFTVEEG